MLKNRKSWILASLAVLVLVLVTGRTLALMVATGEETSTTLVRAPQNLDVAFQRTADGVSATNQGDMTAYVRVAVIPMFAGSPPDQVEYAGESILVNKEGRQYAVTVGTGGGWSAAGGGIYYRTQLDPGQGAVLQLQSDGPELQILTEAVSDPAVWG